MITKFKLFENIEQTDKDWVLILDISKIYSLYENNNELSSFNDNYINFLNEQKSLIIEKTSQDAWSKLENLINRLSENKDKLEDSNSIWDDIYDWGDGNKVQIKATNELEKDF